MPFSETSGTREDSRDQTSREDAEAGLTLEATIHLGHVTATPCAPHVTINRSDEPDKAIQNIKGFARHT